MFHVAWFVNGCSFSSTACTLQYRSSQAGNDRLSVVKGARSVCQRQACCSALGGQSLCMQRAAPFAVAALHTCRGAACVSRHRHQQCSHALCGVCTCWWFGWLCWAQPLGWPACTEARHTDTAYSLGLPAQQPNAVLCCKVLPRTWPVPDWAAGVSTFSGPTEADSRRAVLSWGSGCKMPAFSSWVWWLLSTGQ